MPDNVWSGVPDELRQLVRTYHDASLEAFNNAHSGFTSLARFDAAEAALADALRDLVRDRTRLEVFFGEHRVLLDTEGKTRGLDLERWRALVDAMMSPGRRRAAVKPVRDHNEPEGQ